MDSGALEGAISVLEKMVLYFPVHGKTVKFKYICEQNLPPAAYLTTINNLNTKLKYQDILEYFYYGAMVYIGLRRWEDALEYLESAITYPLRDSSSVSKIMTEAYKKWVLVSVLVSGKALPPPKTVSTNVLKLFHTMGKPYDTLASIFELSTASRLKAEADVGKIFVDDGNLGLVLNVLAAYQKNQIRNLANIYSKVSISEIQSMTKSAETGGIISQPATETLVRDMIKDGELNATLSQPTTGSPILTFSSKVGPIISETEMQQQLREAASQINFLSNEIKQTDRNLLHDKEYIKHVQKQEKNKSKGDAGVGGQDMEWNNGDDETLMDGVF